MMDLNKKIEIEKASLMGGDIRLLQLLFQIAGVLIERSTIAKQLISSNSETERQVLIDMYEYHSDKLKELLAIKNKQ